MHDRPNPTSPKGRPIHPLLERQGLPGPFTVSFMNLYEQLLVVRERLEGIGAHDDSMDLVEKLLKQAEPIKNDKTSISQIQVLRHIIRLREVSDNYNVYNDLQELISEKDETEIMAREDAAPAAYIDTERRPKPRSFYKERARKDKDKDKEKKKEKG